jgi:hypothetical protein
LELQEVAVDIKEDIKVYIQKRFLDKASPIFLNNVLTVIDEASNDKNGLLSASEKICKMASLFIDKNMAKELFDILKIKITSSEVQQGSNKKVNCWEYMKCNKESSGRSAQDSNVCPASTDWRLHGMHGGENAGRACWVVAGTICNGQVQGLFAQKHKNCGSCVFYKKVKDEEADNFLPTITLLEITEEKRET